MGKARHKISNWQQYNQELVNRGSVTFWIDVTAIKAWYCLKHHCYRGPIFIFPDTEIEMALMVNGISKLPLRGLKILLNLVFILINIPIKSPTYTCISKRSKSVSPRTEEQRNNAHYSTLKQRGVLGGRAS
ncbi:Mobile element protein [Candidatus Enterovibrio escicola]|uniref:Mobile element protein n=2 Tax=Candidatus Enterovibrio escicola TaxID=1927127 RepID=A0A2A5T2T1_9GAMM|nr:Mobile element protein [Candidatus Enterovibrio escacola]